MEKAKYKRILLKASGESYCEPGAGGIDPARIVAFARELKSIVDTGIEVAVVTGGGNYIRGAAYAREGLTRQAADVMGMMATMINGVALVDALKAVGCGARLFSAAGIDGWVDKYNRERALTEIEKGNVVVLAGGTGNTLFTTDTAAAQRALDLDCDVLFKATKVDGVFDSDPVANPGAEHFPEIGYDEFLKRDLKVIDATAISLARAHSLPIRVFTMRKEGNLLAAATGGKTGSVIAG